jgi:hypothetical protein
LEVSTVKTKIKKLRDERRCSFGKSHGGVVTCASRGCGWQDRRRWRVRNLKNSCSWKETEQGVF